MCCLIVRTDIYRKVQHLGETYPQPANPDAMDLTMQSAWISSKFGAPQLIYLYFFSSQNLYRHTRRLRDLREKIRTMMAQRNESWGGIKSKPSYFQTRWFVQHGKPASSSPLFLLGNLAIVDDNVRNIGVSSKSAPL